MYADLFTNSQRGEQHHWVIAFQNFFFLILKGTFLKLLQTVTFRNQKKV